MININYDQISHSLVKTFPTRSSLFRAGHSAPQTPFSFTSAVVPRALAYEVVTCSRIGFAPSSEATLLLVSTFGRSFPVDLSKVIKVYHDRNLNLSLMERSLRCSPTIQSINQSIIFIYSFVCNRCLNCAAPSFSCFLLFLLMFPLYTHVIPCIPMLSLTYPCNPM